jgi:two-component sensor histidine kinase
VEGRRAALRGWVYQPYHLRDLMQGMLGGWETHERGLLRLRLYDGSREANAESEAALLYDSAQWDPPGPPQLSLLRTIDFGGAKWTVRFDRVRPLDYLPMWRALAAGLSTSLLLFALAQAILSTQRRAHELAVRLTADLRESEQRLLQMVGKMQGTEALLRDSLREKESLVKEVHHRVKNNLQVMVSLLGLQLEVTGDDGAASALRDSQERIRSMALIHEQLYGSTDLSHIDLASYVRDLVAGLTTVFRRAGGSRVEVRAEPLWVQIDTAIPCGLILSELVSNALKYAVREGAPGLITVGLQAQGAVAGARTLTLVVADDGPGLPAENLPARAGSLGLRLVHILAKQLRGEVAVDSQPGGGARFTVTLREKGGSAP